MAGNVLKKIIKLFKRKQKKKEGAIADPHAAREARKYDNPIPSREFIMELLAVEGLPLTYKEMAARLELNDEARLEALSRRLRAMERDGQLVRNRKGGYCLVNDEDLIAGRVIAHPDGFGFLVPDEGGDDLFLGPREMSSLWHGDRVVVRVAGIDRRGRREGALVEVVERAFSQIVGRLRLEDGVSYVMPDNKRQIHDVMVPTDSIGGAQEGQIVVVDLIKQPAPRRPPVGKVVEVLGDHLAPGMETDVAIRTHGIPAEWPEGVEAETARIGTTVPTEAAKDREDLRDTPLVTIDGEDSRDFDDAVFCKRTSKGWRLLVAIADVSYYVSPESELDKEAFLRGNSVYFPDRVVPMLPEGLSNGLCSINPDVDRLCMTAELLINESGEVYRTRFFEGVMRSHARLTYDKVAAMLIDGDPALCEEYAEVLPHLHELYQLYQVLHKARKARGAIDFDTAENRFVFENGKVTGVVPVVRNDAHRLIEECMLVANVAAARTLLRKKIPALYRVHERPSEAKLTDLHQFLNEQGLKLGGGMEPTAKDYAELLEQVKDRPDANVIQTVLLRSMMQAVYTSENLGHFGLAFDAYTHFTSPIRRYPDLMVHRALKHMIANGTAEDFDYSEIQLATFGEHCSMTERRADDATRDAMDTLKCEFMLDKVGQVFDGVISGVNSFGLFVEVADVYITGLVHVTALDHDYFHFDPIHHKLTGERTGKVYRLGEPIQIKIAAVNLDDRKIDLVLPDGEIGAAKKKPRGKGGPRGGKGRGRSRGPRSAGKGTEQAKAESSPAADAAKGGAEGEPKKKKRRRRRKPKSPQS